MADNSEHQLYEWVLHEIHKLESDTNERSSFLGCCTCKGWGRTVPGSRNLVSRNHTYLYWHSTIRFSLCFVGGSSLNKPPFVQICQHRDRYTPRFEVAVFEVCNQYPKMSIKTRLFTVGRSLCVIFSALTFSR